MTDKPLRIAVIGAGRIGMALGRLLAEAGHRITGVSRRSPAGAEEARAFIGAERAETDAVSAAREAEVVLITTPDRAVRAICQELAAAGLARRDVTWVHTSGALSADAMAVPGAEAAERLAMHPLQAVADPAVGISLLRTCWYGLEGSPAALELGRRLVAEIGARAFEVPSAAKVLYHAAAAVASNYLVVVAAMALDLWERAGLDRQAGLPALVALMRGTLSGVERLGVPRALTGPVERGDAWTVRQHLQAMEASGPVAAGVPSASELYRILGRAAVGLARRKGSLSPEAARAVLEALAGDASSGGGRGG